MAVQVTLPGDVERRLEKLVERGEFPDVNTAAEHLVREALRERDRERSEDEPWTPRNLPPSERPIDPDVSDVNWM